MLGNMGTSLLHAGCLCCMLAGKQRPIQVPAIALCPPCTLLGLPARENIAGVSGVSVRLAPAAAALAIAPDFKLSAAVCAATREEEQAVSMAREGPFRPNAYDRRPAATDRLTPAATTAALQAGRCRVQHKTGLVQCAWYGLHAKA
jgi:hypothetical protein